MEQSKRVEGIPCPHCKRGKLSIKSVSGIADVLYILACDRCVAMRVKLENSGEGYTLLRLGLDNPSALITEVKDRQRRMKETLFNR